MIRIYAKTISYEDFVEDMKYIDSQLSEVQPERTTFVYQDEEGNDVLRTAHHSFEDGEMVTRWDILYHGKMVKVPAEIDEEGNIITEATYWKGERADMYLSGSRAQQMYFYLQSQGILKNLPNGSEFVTPNPETPDTLLAGEQI